ncbi:hypothetical protein BH09VER1_BH09VER1_12810 [soil metagenome]
MTNGKKTNFCVEGSTPFNFHRGHITGLITELRPTSTSSKKLPEGRPFDTIKDLIPICPMNTSRHFLGLILLSVLFASPFAVAGEVEVDLTDKSRVYVAKDGTCDVVPNTSGTGIRIEYNFEKSAADWANIQFDVPSLDSITKIIVTARGTPAALSAIALRNEKNDAYSYRFGPITEDGFQTYELDPHAPMQTGGKKDAVEISYPISKIFFQIKAKGSQGFLEVSKVVFETN